MDAVAPSRSARDPEPASAAAAAELVAGDDPAAGAVADRGEPLFSRAEPDGGERSKLWLFFPTVETGTGELGGYNILTPVIALICLHPPHRTCRKAQPGIGWCRDQPFWCSYPYALTPPVYDHAHTPDAIRSATATAVGALVHRSGGAGARQPRFRGAFESGVFRAHGHGCARGGTDARLVGTGSGAARNRPGCHGAGRHRWGTGAHSRRASHAGGRNRDVAQRRPRP